MLFYVYSNYIDNSTSNYTTEMLSRDDTFLSNTTYHTTCQCHLKFCAKLITNELRGVVCVDHIQVKCI